WEGGAKWEVRVGIGGQDGIGEGAELGDVVGRQRVPLGKGHGPRLAVETGVEAQRARASTHVRGLRLENGAAMAAALQLEGCAEAGQARAQDHHVHAARRLGDGAEIVERCEAEGRPGRDAEPAKELSAGEGKGGRQGHECPYDTFSRWARACQALTSCVPSGTIGAMPRGPAGYRSRGLT